MPEPYRSVGLVETRERPAPESPERPWSRARWYADRALACGPMAAAVTLFFTASAFGLPAIVASAVLGLAGSLLAARRFLVSNRDAWYRQNEAAVKLLAAGKGEEAERALSLLVEESRAHPRDQVVFLMNLASSLVWRDVDRAIGILRTVEASGWLSSREALAVLRADIACCHALRGEPEKAEAALAEAHELGRPVPLLAEVVVACRTGRYTNAVRDVEKGRTAIAMMSAPAAAMAHLLHAFALERLGRSADDVARALQGAQAYDARHAQTLTMHWLDLAEFARRHGLLDDA